MSRIGRIAKKASAYHKRHPNGTWKAALKRAAKLIKK
jgi:hypothetical protein